MPRLLVHSNTISLASVHACRCCLVFFALAITSGGFSQSSDPSSRTSEELWWTYLADYEGSPGSIVLDMALKAQAPNPAYPKLVVTGVTYPSLSGRSGLPDEKQLDSLSDISDKRLAMIQQRCGAIMAGSFTYRNERLDYIYVSDTKGLEEALRAFYAKECPTRQPYINVKDDAQWQAYLEFLYPNARTMDFYRQELIELGVLKK